jgi:hypothetical protein
VVVVLGIKFRAFPMMESILLLELYPWSPCPFE